MFCSLFSADARTSRQARRAEEARKVEEAKAEAARKAEEERQAELARERAEAERRARVEAVQEAHIERQRREFRGAEGAGAAAEVASESGGHRGHTR